MKVLFVANAFPGLHSPNRGAFNFRAVRQLSEMHSVDVVTLRSWRPGRKFVEEYEINGIKVVAFSFLYYDRLGNFMTAFFLWNYIRAFNFFYKSVHDYDIIHSVGGSHAGILGAFLNKKTSIPHIAQIIGSDINFMLPKIEPYLGMKKWSKYVSIFACNSEELKKEVLKRYGGVKARVVYRGVDLSEFDCREGKTNSPPLTFLYIGGLSPRKGNPHGMDLKGGVTLLKAWKEFILSKKSADGTYELLYGGPDVTDSKIETILKGSLKDYSIRNIGYVDKFGIASLMCKTHVVIVPSMAEGLPNVAMEGAAAANAIIASSIGGIPEVVIHEKTGLLVAPSNVQELLSAIDKLSGDTFQLIEMGKAAKQFISENFSASGFAKSYSHLYESAKEL